MATRSRECPECGSRFIPCTTIRPGDSFNWRLKTCSPACGQSYLKKVRAARARDEVADTLAKQEAEVPQLPEVKKPKKPSNARGKE